MSRHRCASIDNKHIKDFVTTFADQAVIAVQNARLFDEIQQKSRELEAQLAEANRHKSLFVANMSHELRTPLNAIIGYSEMLQEECEDLGHTDLVLDLECYGAGKHLLALINNVLDLSKIEAGRMELFLEDFAVDTLLREVAAVVQPLVEKNHNRFEIQVSPGLATMHADLTKVRQTLFNLLSNAAKFTEHGTVTLTAERVTEAAGDWLTFAVCDTGIGLTAEQRAGCSAPSRRRRRGPRAGTGARAWGWR